VEDIKQKFKIEITEEGSVIIKDQENGLTFTAGEALMLLDVLTQEESKLRELAQKASPLPIRLRFRKTE
jgi:hypothetical protein